MSEELKRCGSGCYCLAQCGDVYMHAAEAEMDRRGLKAWLTRKDAEEVIASIFTAKPVPQDISNFIAENLWEMMGDTRRSASSTPGGEG